jgi:hypothetical protein
VFRSRRRAVSASAPRLREIKVAAQILVVLLANVSMIFLLGLDHRFLRLDLVIGIAQPF